MGQSVQLDWSGPAGLATIIQLCATPTNPCYDPTPVCIDIIPPPHLDPYPTDPTVCEGEEVVFEWQGPPGQTYTWTTQPFHLYIGSPPAGSGDLIFTAQNPTNMNIFGGGHVFAWLGGCQGAWYTWAVNVKPAPSVDPIPDLTVCGGESVGVVFEGSPGATFTWTNDNPAIGLAASGSGNIVFTAPKVPGPQTATVTVTAHHTLNDCTSQPVSFQITVNGTVVDDPPNITVCPGEPVNVNFTGTGSSYTWTNTNSFIGLSGDGMGNISFIAEGTPQQQTAVVTVTPQPCPFASQSFTITVLPAVFVNPPPNIEVCGGQPVNIPLTGSAGTTFNWTNSNPAIGLPDTGSGNIVFTAPKVLTTQTAIITVTPDKPGACKGEPVYFTITVKSCCATDAGTLDTAAIGVCGPKIVAVKHQGNQNLEPNDTIRYILYTNPANPLGSVIQYSDSLFFPFLPDTMHFDSVYYAAVIAGNHLPNDSIDAADPCFSIFKGPKIVWWKKPTIAVHSPPDAVCRDGCVEVLFDLEGRPPFEFTWQVSQGATVLLARQVTTNEKQLVVLVCPQDFDVPPVPNGGLLGFMVSNFGDKVCWCGE